MSSDGQTPFEIMQKALTEMAEAVSRLPVSEQSDDFSDAASIIEHQNRHDELLDRMRRARTSHLRGMMEPGVLGEN